MRRLLDRGRRPGALPFLPALFLGAFGGLTLALAFPRTDWWWAAVPGVALILGALRGRTIRGAALVGVVAGECCYAPLISWATLFLGPVPWLALATLEALFFMLGAMAIAAAYAWVPRRCPRTVVALLVAGLWTARDAVSSTWPYGGFAWGRVAQSQADAPWIGLLSWLGLAGVGLLLVWWAALLVELVAVRRRRLLHSALLLLTVLVACLIPRCTLPGSGSATIVGVQGGTEEAGYFKAGAAGAVQQAQVDAMAGLPVGAHYDLIVWPETGAEFDPLADPGTRELVAGLSEKYQAPLLVGAAHQDPDGRIYNTVQLWDGATLTGRFDKRHPVPFGEYVPDREFWAKLDPKDIALIGRGYTPGTSSPVLSAGTVQVGAGICFDVIDDQLAHDAVAGGAQVLVYPTNNADFGRTAELDQQAAFARLRAIETGRAAVQVSSVGHTVAYGPDGATLASLPWYQPGFIVVQVPTVSGRTAAFWVGGPLQAVAAWGSLVALASLGTARLVVRRRSRPGRRHDERPRRSPDPAPGT